MHVESLHVESHQEQTPTVKVNKIAIETLNI
jgi:hypothetical protein